MPSTSGPHSVRETSSSRPTHIWHDSGHSWWDVLFGSVSPRWVTRLVDKVHSWRG